MKPGFSQRSKLEDLKVHMCHWGWRFPIPVLVHHCLGSLSSNDNHDTYGKLVQPGTILSTGNPCFDPFFPTLCQTLPNSYLCHYHNVPFLLLIVGCQTLVEKAPSLSRVLTTFAVSLIDSLTPAQLFLYFPILLLPLSTEPPLLLCWDK